MKAGVVGCGAIAPLHIEALKGSGIEIAYLCDSVIEKAADLKVKHGLDARLTPEFSDILNDAEVDCVHLCTPHYLHKPMILDALSHSKNVFTEKPLCLNSAEAEEIRLALKDSDRQVGICFQNRYLPANLAMKRLSASNANTGGSCHVIWSRDERYYTDSGWRGKKNTEGGGVLINQAIHTLDLLMWFMGEPQYVSANIDNHHLKGVIDVEDTAEGYIEFDGATANFYATTAAPLNLPIEIVIKGKKNLRLIGETLIVNGKKKRIPVQKNKPWKDYWGAGHAAIVADFYDCLKTGRRFSIDVNEAAKSILLIERIYESKGDRIRI